MNDIKNLCSFRPALAVLLLGCLISAAVPCRADTSGEELDRTLTDALRSELRERIGRHMEAKRLKLEGQGKDLVEEIAVADLPGGIAGLEYLDPFHPDPAKRKMIEQELVRRIKQLPVIASYTGLSVVNTEIENRAEELLVSGLAGAAATRVKRAFQATPQLARRFTLDDLVNRDSLIARIARAKWDGDEQAASSTASSFDRLPQERRRVILESARDLVASRERYLAAEAKKRLDLVRSNPLFRWPALDPESDKVKKAKIDEAVRCLFAAAQIPLNIPPDAGAMAELEGAPTISQYAHKLAAQWFRQQFSVALRSDQLARLKNLEEKIRRGEFPLPDVPDPDPRVPSGSDLSDPEKVDRFVEGVTQRLFAGALKQYVPMAMRHVGIDPERAADDVRTHLTDLVKPHVNACIKEYVRYAVEWETFRRNPARFAGLPGGSGPGTAGSAGRPIKGIPAERQAQRAHIRRILEMAGIRDEMEKVADKYRLDRYKLTPQDFLDLQRRHHVPQEVVKALQHLAGVDFEDQRSFDARVQKALAGMKAERYLPQILEQARLDPRAPPVPSSESKAYGNEYLRERAVDYHRKRILKGLGYTSRPQDPNDAKYQLAVRVAEDQAQDLVDRQAAYSAAMDKRAEELEKRMESEATQARLNQALTPFGDLRDRRAFVPEGKQEDVARAIASEVFSSQPPEVRYHPDIIDGIKQQLADKSREVREKLAEAARRVYWSEPNRRSEGPVRDDVVQQQGLDERTKAIEEGIIRGLIAKHPELVSVIQDPAAQKILREAAEEQVTKLLNHVPPESVKAAFRGFLDREVGLGKAGMPGAGRLTAIGDRRQRKKTIVERIQQQMKAHSVYGRLAESQPLQEAIDQRAEELLAQVDSGGSGPGTPSARSSPFNLTRTLPGGTAPLQSVQPPAQQDDPREQFDLIVTISTRGNSHIGDVTIVCERIDFRSERKINFVDERSYSDGVQKVIEQLEGRMPDLIIKAFSDTRGQGARFGVTMHTKGKMLPIAVPGDFANALDTFFKSLHARNSLVMPIFEEYTTDQGMKGRISDLIPDARG